MLIINKILRFNIQGSNFVVFPMSLETHSNLLMVACIDGGKVLLIATLKPRLNSWQPHEE